MKSIIFAPENKCILEYTNGKTEINEYTKGALIDRNEKLVMNYQIRNIGGEDYLILDWKSGDYIFAKQINCCYVFKRVK